MASTPASVTVDVSPDVALAAVGRVTKALARRLPALGEIIEERQRQDDKWGEQNHPDGTGPGHTVAGIDVVELARQVKAETDAHADAGTLTYAQILLEEVLEAFAEDDPVKLRTELVQSAAVAVAWVEAIDRRRYEQAKAEVESDTHEEGIHDGRCGECGEEWHEDRCGRWCSSSNPAHWCSDCLSCA